MKCHAAAGHGPAFPRGAFGPLCDDCWESVQIRMATVCRRHGAAERRWRCRGLGYTASEHLRRVLDDFGQALEDMGPE